MTNFLLSLFHANINSSRRGSSSMPALHATRLDACQGNYPFSCLSQLRIPRQLFKMYLCTFYGRTPADIHFTPLLWGSSCLHCMCRYEQFICRCSQDNRGHSSHHVGTNCYCPFGGHPSLLHCQEWQDSCCKTSILNISWLLVVSVRTPQMAEWNPVQLGSMELLLGVNLSMIAFMYTLCMYHTYLAIGVFLVP